MPSSYSPLLRFEEIGAGEQSGLWGDTTNKNLGTLVEQAIAGVTTVSLSGPAGDYTLSALNGAKDEARAAVLKFIGSPSGPKNIIIPTSTKLYVVRNDSGQTISVKTAAQVTGVTILNGEATLVFCDGSNAVAGIATAGVGPTTVANGGTAATSFTGGFIKSPGGTGALTSSATVNLATETSGTLTVPNGGTGNNSFPLGRVLIGSGTSAISGLAGVTPGQVLGWNGTIWEPTTLSSSGVTSFSGGTTGLTPSSATSGVVTLGGTLGVTNGGTGATTQSGARSNLGLGSVSTINTNASTTQFLRGDGTWNTPPSGVLSITAGTGLSGGTISSGGSGTIALANTGVSAGTYTNATVTVDSQGRITSANSGSGGGVTSVSVTSPITNTGSSTAPNIGVLSASSSNSGVVTTSSQTFAGQKTFQGGSVAGLRSDGYNYFPPDSTYFNANSFITSNAFGCSGTGVPSNAGIYYDIIVKSWVVNIGTGFATFAFTNSFLTPGGDNAYSLGDPTRRWSVVYAANGSINTSDANEKTEIRDLTEAEKRVAQRIKGLIKTYKWKASVAEKGSDGARIHVGVIAQEVKAAFEAEGLDAHRYGMFCYDEWDAKPASVNGDGVVMQEAIPAGARYGVRYEELLSFVIAAL